MDCEGSSSGGIDPIINVKVLIVTYTYPPAKSVNGFRPFQFAKILKQAGWEVEVLTRHFSGNESLPEDYNKRNNTPFSISAQPEALVYRVPFYNSWFKYYDITWIRNSGLWRFIYFIQLLLGRVAQESHNSYFKTYLPSILRHQKYDVVIVESGPTNLVRLVSKYAIKQGIIYTIDFRDAYYHEMYQDFSSLPWNKKLKIRLEEWYMAKPIKNAARVFSLSDAWLDILKVPHRLREVVNNGFDASEWDKIKPNPNPNKFVIASIGTLYDKPFLIELLKAISLFLEKQSDQVEVKFIAPGNTQVINKIKQYLPYANVKIDQQRKTYRESIQSIADADVLIYHGWKGWRELAGTKIYDYLRSGNYILVVPSDDGIIARLINPSEAGVITDSPDEAAVALVRWYTAWTINGSLLPKVDKIRLEVYSREYQSAILEKSLRSLIQNV